MTQENNIEAMTRLMRCYGFSLRQMVPLEENQSFFKMTFKNAHHQEIKFIMFHSTMWTETMYRELIKTEIAKIKGKK